MLTTPATIGQRVKRPFVLLVDDQIEERSALANALEHDGFDVREEAHDGRAQPNHVRTVDAVVSTLRFRTDRGLHFVRSWRRDRPDTPFIAIAGENQIEPAIEAMRIGVCDCLPQPVQPDRLTASLRRILSIQRTDDVPSTERYDKANVDFNGIIGRSTLMREVFSQVERIAPTAATVLITGATGTGKELLAQAIHRMSRRSSRPFVAVNAAAVPTTLLESELFGHVKGAFTDAAADRVGRFEAADGGTLFIDEIGDLKLPAQAKLLRALESRVINRVGSNDDTPVDVRIIAATSRDMERIVSDGQFREDLYYRLNILRIDLPELRQRREDIPLLVEYFLETFARMEHRSRSQPQVAPTLMDYFLHHAWPGNIRQLRNCLESMFVLSLNGSLTLEQLPKSMLRITRPSTLKNLPLAGNSLAELERNAIEQTLDQSQGNRTRAADLLGISVRTLQRKLKQWDNCSA